MVNRDQLLGKWKQVRGKVKEQWGKLTDDDLDQIAGKGEQLAGKIQEKYGVAREKANEQVDQFLSDCDC